MAFLHLQQFMDAADGHDLLQLLVWEEGALCAAALKGSEQAKTVELEEGELCAAALKGVEEVHSKTVELDDFEEGRL